MRINGSKKKALQLFVQVKAIIVRKWVVFALQGLILYQSYNILYLYVTFQK